MAPFSAARSFSRSAPLRRVLSDLAVDTKAAARPSVRLPKSLAAGTKAAARRSVRLPKSPAAAPRFLRNPVEISSCLESLLPLHSVTASALMTSLISVSPRTYGWFSQDDIP